MCGKFAVQMTHRPVTRKYKTKTSVIVNTEIGRPSLFDKLYMCHEN
jgi:hypothetical protein